MSDPSERLSAVPPLRSNDSTSNRVANLPGYNTPVFKGKEDQRALVEKIVASKVIHYLAL